jgi:ELWxxDGT repeat protein
MSIPFLVKDIFPGSSGSYPSLVAAFGDAIFFNANEGTNGYELWKSDGTATGTALVKDINSSGSSSPRYLTAVGNTLFFVANNGDNGYELWKSDGTAAGTVLVKDIRPGSDGSSLSDLTAVGNTLFFSADDGVNGSELWKSDGTEAGTVLVKDIYPGSDSSSLSNLTAVGNTLFFSADNGVNGSELWKSDGTEAGTILVKDINSSGSSSPRYLRVVGNTLFFASDNGPAGRELWKSDGTEAGTVLVKDIRPGSSSAIGSNNLTAVGNTLFFRANDGVRGDELWKSDGTEAGTVLVKDIISGSSASQPANLTAVGNTLFFRAFDAANGSELWKSDGTEAGTVLVKDIYPGGNSNLSRLTAVGNIVFFRANDGVNGYELWRSDGTEAGTALVADINPGGSSSPDQLLRVENILFFSADNGADGNELWALDVNEAPTDLNLQNINNGFTDGNTTATAVKIADLLVTDDALGNNTFSLRGIDADFFDLQGDDLFIKAGTTLDVNTKGDYNLTLTVDDLDVGLSPDVSPLYSFLYTNLTVESNTTTVGNTEFLLQEIAKIQGFDGTETDAEYNFILQATANLSQALGSSPLPIFKQIQRLNQADAIEQATISLVQSFASKPDLQQAISPILNQLKTDLSTHGEDVKPLVQQAFAQLRGVFTEAGLLDNPSKDLLNTVKTNALLIIQQLNADLANHENDAKPLVQQALGQLEQIVTDYSAELFDPNPFLILAGLTDQNITPSYKITGVDAALFNIDSATGQLSFKTVPNFAAPADANGDNRYDVQVQVADGYRRFIQFQTIIIDPNEPPTAVVLNNQVTTLAENSDTTNRIKVADIIVTDDGLGTNNLSLSGADAAIFEIISAELFIKAGTVLDFETQASFDVTVEVDDPAVGATPDDSAVFTLNLIDQAVFSIGNVTVNENAGTAVFTVTATDPIAVGTAGVSYATSNITAFGSADTSGDYVPASGSLSFSSGVTTQTINVAINDDALYEPTPETFRVSLSNPTNATIANGVGVGTINDNDSPVSLSVRDTQVLEGNSGETRLLFQVDLSTRSGEAVSVNYATSDGTAIAGSDYTAATGTLVIGAGNLSGLITILVKGDADVEPNETLTLTLSDAAGATIGDNAGTGTIVNDDTATGITLTGTPGNDTLRGNSAAPPTSVPDEIFEGFEGNDNLFGYYGNNTFNGGPGADNLSGLTGRDIFQYAELTDSLLNSRDTIVRFNASEGDRIALVSEPGALFYAGVVTAANLGAAVSAAYGNVDGAGTDLGADEALFFKFGTSYYLSVNDSTPAFDSATDLLLRFGTFVNAPTVVSSLTVADYLAPI